ncbi:nucleotide exchange factor GrpE [Chloracidobacterium sp. MS 40/45]|uniref:nucleotide exchange factor GrpE n=1 Tax=Chloracidobacterium aggregatum TaxID=2851959 RepID=UPI001B8B772F|nr:nucleotide exchange factor GrpE [Chloracidobacterium aggregatum]QUV99339.1 nucleotide exchange factor GrpE [Chloracidobacterium sp. MS 40/45]
MNTPVGNVMPKLDVAAPKSRTIEIEFPMETPPADERLEVTASAPAATPPAVSVPDPVEPVENVLEPEESGAAAKTADLAADAPTAYASDAAGTTTEAAADAPAPAAPQAAEPTAEPAAAPTEDLPAGGVTSGSQAFSEDETIKLLMDLASLQEDLERAREQTNSARRHVEIVQEQLSKTLVEKSTVQDQLQRLMAEFDNYRRRAEREKAEAMERGKQAVLLATLEVLDNLERALATGRAEGGTLADFLAGVELIQRQVVDSLSSFGVKPVPAVGEIFDPTVHEAIATDETDEYKPNTVLAELKRGYTLGDRLLRPAMVRVAVRPAAS